MGGKNNRGMINQNEGCVKKSYGYLLLQSHLRSKRVNYEQCFHPRKLCELLMKSLSAKDRIFPCEVLAVSETPPDNIGYCCCLPQLDSKTLLLKTTFTRCKTAQSWNQWEIICLTVSSMVLGNGIQGGVGEKRHQRSLLVMDFAYHNNRTSLQGMSTIIVAWYLWVNQSLSDWF